jgi:biotin carboxylase
MTCEVLLLTPWPVSKFPIWEWLPGANVRVVASAEHNSEAIPGPADVQFVDGYTYSAAVDLAVLDTCRRRPVDHLIALWEYDVGRAAALRAHLGLPGQRSASAAAYRDKVTMKMAWQRAGIPVADFSAIDSPADLLTFTRQQGYPVVVKPRRAAGSVDVSVLDGEAQAEAWLASNWQMPLGASSPWMVEAFIAGRMMEVDGIWIGGRAEINWPSVASSRLDWTSGRSSLTICLGADDSLVPRAQEMVMSALKALPDSGGPIIYHAEVWEREDGTLAMNELAARIGGGLTRELIRVSFGVDLIERFVRGTIEPGVFGEPVPDRPRLIAGEIFIPPPVGEVLAIGDLPGELQVPWLRNVTISARPGKRYHGPSHGTDMVAACVAEGGSAAEVKERLLQFEAWARASIHYAAPAAMAGPSAGLFIQTCRTLTASVSGISPYKIRNVGRSSA